MPSARDNSQSHLAAIVSSSEDAIIGKDLNGYITSWNDAAQRMFGYAAHEIMGKHVSTTVPSSLQSEEDHVLNEVRAGRSVDHYETTRVHKNGNMLAVSIAVSPIRGLDGAVVGASLIARDISDRRDREREALRLAAIVTSSDDAIVSKDLNGIIQTWNRAAERMFGYTAEEAVGKSITIIIPEDRLPEETTVLTHIKAGLPIEHFETIRRRKDGTFVDVSLSVSPIIRPDGTVIGASKIARDITDRKRLERAADEASRMKDEFLAVLSHELRTPLNTVMGYMRMLRRDDLQPELRERALDAMQRNTEALTQLVNDVLDTSRIVTGKLRLVFAPVSLPLAISDAVETVRTAADSKGIQLQVDTPETLEVVGDQDRLRQVLWNLLSNAVKFTPRGGRVRVEGIAERGSAVIRVSDTGIGIAREHLPYVFHRFWQAESGASREYSGLGIGLALARHIVEMHGGTIEVVSDGADTGATVTVTLPRSGMSTGASATGSELEGTESHRDGTPSAP